MSAIFMYSRWFAERTSVHVELLLLRRRRNFDLRETHRTERRSDRKDPLAWGRPRDSPRESRRATGQKLDQIAALVGFDLRGLNRVTFDDEDDAQVTSRHR